MRKPDFCICENKGADQLHDSRAADQHLCFHYTDSMIPLNFLNPEFQYSMAVQPGLFQTRSETPEDRFSHNAAQVLYLQKVNIRIIHNSNGSSHSKYHSSRRNKVLI